jgi:hypothetical protein
MATFQEMINFPHLIKYQKYEKLEGGFSAEITSKIVS